MKKSLIFPALLLIVALLAGCAPKDQPEVDLPVVDSYTGQPQPDPMNITTPEPDLNVTLPDGIDPLAEEEYGEGVEYIGPAATQGSNAQPQTQNFTVGSGTTNPFAGATPIPLNPIDMPTAPPREALTFTYTPYTAARLGLTFESVAGYEIDESSVDGIILREPSSMWKDNKGVVITLSRSTVASNYSKADVRKDVIAKLADIGEQNYKTWQPSNTAERSLMNAPGYYADFRGVLADDTIVRGRVHMALLPGNQVLTLMIEHPAEYNTDYIGVHSHIRSTLKSN